MQIEKTMDSESIQFFLEDANKPAVVMGLDGVILKVNKLFRENFDLVQPFNIRELFDCTNTSIWDGYFKSLASKSTTVIARRTVLAVDKRSLIKVRLLYCPKDRRVAATFTMPTMNKVLPVNYLNVFKKSDNFMIITDQNGVIVDANELSEEFFNISGSELIGKVAFELLTNLVKNPCELTEFRTMINAEGNAETTFQRTDRFNETKHYNINTFFDSESNLYVTRMIDRTKTYELEEQLAHADSLSSIGKLAASIAHEIRNPMTTLKGFVQLLKATSPEESQNYLAVIDEEIERMESILTEMLCLSKPNSSEKEILSLKDAVNDVCKVIYPKAQSGGIKIIQTDSASSDALIYANSGKIKQVLLNVFKNGLEAMPSGGTLTIHIENDEQGMILLSIADTGVGMTDSQVTEIFTPFFTMKETGTGLGLPFVKRTLTEYNGAIKVESEIGQGTKFVLSFPSAANYLSFGVDNNTFPETGQLV